MAEAQGTAERVAEIKDELRLAAGLTALCGEEGLSQREPAKRMGVSQPRVAAIEQARNVTIDVLEQYIEAVGGWLDVNVVKGRSRIPLTTGIRPAVRSASPANRKRSSRTGRAGNGVDAAERATG